MILASQGNKPIIRIPLEFASKAISEFKQMGIETHAKSNSSIIGSIPRDLLILSSFTLFLSYYNMNSRGVLFMLANSALVALALFFAYKKLSEPLINTATINTLLPKELEEKLLKTISSLETNNARNLLCDIFKTADEILSKEDDKNSLSSMKTRIAKLLEDSCNTALNLSIHDKLISRLEGYAKNLLSKDQIEKLSQLEKSRDTLSQQLLQILSSLGNFTNNQSLLHCEEVNAQTQELILELSLRKDAREEIESFLSSA